MRKHCDFPDPEKHILAGMSMFPYNFHQMYQLETVEFEKNFINVIKITDQYWKSIIDELELYY